jgi:hypothetical protein
MNLDSKLLMSLKKRSGNVVLRRELAGLGSASQLSAALQHLIADGRLVRIGAGVYAKTGLNLEGKAHFAVGDEVLLREALAKLGVEVRDITIQRENGRSFWLVNTSTSRISRKLKWNNIVVRYVGQHQRGERAQRLRCQQTSTSCQPEMSASSLSASRKPAGFNTGGRALMISRRQ